jgi:hypothetical protein
VQNTSLKEGGIIFNAFRLVNYVLKKADKHINLSGYEIVAQNSWKKLKEFAIGYEV